MITQQVLDTYSDKIEERMKQLRLPVNVTDCNFYDHSGFVELIIEPKYDAFRKTIPNVDAIITAQKNIANAVGTTDLRIYQNRAAQICVEIQVENPPPPTMEELTVGLRPYQLPLGRDRLGNTLAFDLTDPSCAHLLIAGTTGSGKTALSHSIILNACNMHTPDQLKVAIIDYNNPVADWFYPKIEAHTKRTPTNLAEAESLLRQISSKMFEGRLPYKLLIFVDELAGICEASPEALNSIQVIAQQGRKYGVHLIAATQKPTAAAVGSLLKANMRRAVGKVASPEDSKVATGLAGVGCEGLAGNGAFIFVDAALTRFQAAIPEGYGYNKPEDAPLATGDILDFELNGSSEEQLDAGITVTRANNAISKLKIENLPVTKTNVLKQMGYSNAGGASRRLNKIWDELSK